MSILFCVFGGEKDVRVVRLRDIRYNVLIKALAVIVALAAVFATFCSCDH